MRTSADYEPVEGKKQVSRRRAWLSALLIPGIAFLLGLAAMGWALARWDDVARALGVAPAPVPAAPAAAEPVLEPVLAAEPTPAEPAAEPERIIVDPEITRRVAQLEQRIGEMRQEARAAVGNADRAEGLLVAFAARRALDRGVALGYLEALLRQRFGDTQPQAVGTIITAARNPVTLEELREGLQEVGPELTGAPPDQGWWSALKSELSGLVTVRREGTPSTEPAARLRRAERRLEAGQVDVALAEVLRLPGREHAREWIAAARRYIAARRALDTIETAALLEPRVAQTRPAPNGQAPDRGQAPGEAAAQPARPPG